MLNSTKICLPQPIMKLLMRHRFSDGAAHACLARPKCYGHTALFFGFGIDLLLPQGVLHFRTGWKLLFGEAGRLSLPSSQKSSGQLVDRSEYSEGRWTGGKAGVAAQEGVTRTMPYAWSKKRASTL